MGRSSSNTARGSDSGGGGGGGGGGGIGTGAGTTPPSSKSASSKSSASSSLSRGASSRRIVDEIRDPNQSIFLNGLYFFEEYPYKFILASAGIIFCLFLRYCVALYPHSGMATPPMYGDYEAQRHWMEITTALPVGEWYRNSTDNNLQYWGLDYPPLTAYVSWFFGRVAQQLVPELVELHTSRGIETPHTKLYMRLSVLVTDLVLYMPAVVLFTLRPSRHTRPRTWALRVYYAIMVLLQPALVLIDHGHFQYNSFSLALVLLGVTCALHDYDLLSAVAFSLALNFKQMTLYYSPAFFFFLLAKCFHVKLIRPCQPSLLLTTLAPPNTMQKRTASGQRPSLFVGIARVLCLGVVTIATFAVMWAPFCLYAPPGVGCVENLGQVLHRLFPFERGLFEDKVSNLWCILDVLLKIRRRFSHKLLVRMSTCLTLLLMAPSCASLWRNRHGRRRVFLLALFNISLSFFLASFQVHEKSILLPLLPAALLWIDMPVFATWFGTIASFSMYPLLHRDQLSYPYMLLVPGYLAMALSPDALTRVPRWQWAIGLGSLLGCVFVHIAYVYVPRLSISARYPDLGPVMVSAYACGLFVLSWIYGNVILWRRSSRRRQRGGVAATDWHKHKRS